MPEPESRVEQEPVEEPVIVQKEKYLDGVEKVRKSMQKKSKGKLLVEEDYIKKNDFRAPSRKTASQESQKPKSPPKPSKQASQNSRVSIAAKSKNSRISAENKDIQISNILNRTSEVNVAKSDGQVGSIEPPECRSNASKPPKSPGNHSASVRMQSPQSRGILKDSSAVRSKESEPKVPSSKEAPSPT